MHCNKGGQTWGEHPEARRLKQQAWWRVRLIRRDSVLGLRLWAAARMVEVAYKRFVQQLSGTWAMNAYLRALGARIGDWSNVRLGLCLPLLPDNLAIGAGCVRFAPCIPGSA